MNRNSVTYFLLSIVFVLTMLFSNGAIVKADAPAPDPEQAQYEIEFMQQMIDHHTSAVVMAELCLKRAVHEELIEMCEQMIEDQTEEIEMMSEWLSEWYGIDYDARLSKADREMISHLKKHDKSEFEMHFMHMMIMHHSMAIEMSHMCLEMAYHPELISLCENIITSQAAEIQQMEIWLCEWYGHCDGGHHHHMEMSQNMAA